MNKLATKQITDGVFKDGFVFEDDNAIVKSIDKLPGGIYGLSDIGGMFQTKLLYKPITPKEKYVDVTGGTVGKVMKKAESFFSESIKTKYTELGIAHKTGVVLYGIPGTGKTVTGYIIMDKLVQNYEATCIVINSDVSPRVWRQAIRELEHLKRPVVFFCDECETILHQQEQEWLTFLDGHESISNFMFIGCTNYLHRISKRLKRPSRIEHLISVDSIEEQVAKDYVEQKVGSLDKNIKAAMVHLAMEAHATMDAFKNSVKEYYIYDDKGGPKAFAAILKSYLREEKGDDD